MAVEPLWRFHHLSVHLFVWARCTQNSILAFSLNKEQKIWKNCFEKEKSIVPNSHSKLARPSLILNIWSKSSLEIYLSSESPGQGVTKFYRRIDGRTSPFGRCFSHQNIKNIEEEMSYFESKTLSRTRGCLLKKVTDSILKSQKKKVKKSRKKSKSHKIKVKKSYSRKKSRKKVTLFFKHITPRSRTSISSSTVAIRFLTEEWLFQMDLSVSQSVSHILFYKFVKY